MPIVLTSVAVATPPRIAARITNGKMKPGIATKNARDNMVKNKAPGVMRVVFTDETDIFLGGKEVRMKYYGRGHTNGDAVVYFPALRILAV